MQGLSPSSAEPDSTAADWPRAAPRAYGVWALVAVIAITAARLVLLAVQSADLYPDEAQYWFWSLASGARLLLEAAARRLADRADHDGPWRQRIRHPPVGAVAAAIAAGVVYAVAARLYDRRTGLLGGRSLTRASPGCRCQLS